LLQKIGKDCKISVVVSFTDKITSGAAAAAPLHQFNSFRQLFAQSSHTCEKPRAESARLHKQSAQIHQAATGNWFSRTDLFSENT
jgi:hypothetical protein